MLTEERHGEEEEEYKAHGPMQHRSFSRPHHEPTKQNTIIYSDFLAHFYTHAPTKPHITKQLQPHASASHNRSPEIAPAAGS
jgi:hypothetical protein